MPSVLASAGCFTAGRGPVCLQRKLSYVVMCSDRLGIFCKCSCSTPEACRRLGGILDVDDWWMTCRGQADSEGLVRRVGGGG